MNKLFLTLVCVLTPALSINASAIEKEFHSTSLNTETMFYVGLSPVLVPCSKSLFHINNSAHLGYRIHKNHHGIDSRFTISKFSDPYAKVSMAYEYYFLPGTSTQIYLGLGGCSGKIGKSSFLSVDPFLRIGFQDVTKPKGFLEIQLHPLSNCNRPHAKNRLITEEVIDQAINIVNTLPMPTRAGEEWLERLATKNANEKFREKYLNKEILQEKKSIFPSAKYIPTITISYGIGF